MKYLLDVNVLIGAIWRDQTAHKRAMAWLAGKEIVLCPLAELGFLRISTINKVMGATMDRTPIVGEVCRRDQGGQNSG